MILFKQVKPEAFKSWLLLHTSLQSCAKLFYKCIGYYVINRNTNTNNDTCSIRKQAVGYTIFLKRKQSTKVEEKGFEEGRYH